VQRDGVVDLRADFARGEELAQRIAAGSADHVLVPDVAAAGNFVGQHNTVNRIRTEFGQSCRTEQRVIALRNRSSRIVPAGNVLQLDAEDGGLHAIETRVPSYLVVVVAASHSVLAQHPGALGQLIRIGRHHPGVSSSAQVLGGIKAEGGDIAKPAGFHAVPLSAVSLGRVLDEPQPIFRSEPRE